LTSAGNVEASRELVHDIQSTPALRLDGLWTNKCGVETIAVVADAQFGPIIFHELHQHGRSRALYRIRNEFAEDERGIIVFVFAAGLGAKVERELAPCGRCPSEIAAADPPFSLCSLHLRHLSRFLPRIRGYTAASKKRLLDAQRRKGRV
jgi:hypothetical protein